MFYSKPLVHEFKIGKWKTLRKKIWKLKKTDVRNDYSFPEFKKSSDDDASLEGY